MILAVRWTGENLSEIEQHVEGTGVSVRPDGDNLYLEEGDWSIIVLPEELVIVDTDGLEAADGPGAAEVSVMSETDMFASYSVEWLET